MAEQEPTERALPWVVRAEWRRRFLLNGGAEVGQAICAFVLALVLPTFLQKQSFDYVVGSRRTWFVVAMAAFVVLLVLVWYRRQARRASKGQLIIVSVEERRSPADPSMRTTPLEYWQGMRRWADRHFYDFVEIRRNVDAPVPPVDLEEPSANLALLIDRATEVREELQRVMADRSLGSRGAPIAFGIQAPLWLAWGIGPDLLPSAALPFHSVAASNADESCGTWHFPPPRPILLRTAPQGASPSSEGAARPEGIRTLVHVAFGLSPWRLVLQPFDRVVLVTPNGVLVDPQIPTDQRSRPHVPITDFHDQLEAIANHLQSALQSEGVVSASGEIHVSASLPFAMVMWLSLCCPSEAVFWQLSGRPGSSNCRYVRMAPLNDGGP